MSTNKEINRIIKIGCNASAGVGLIGAVATDAPALAAIWGTMMYKIAKENGVSLDNETCVKIATSIILSASSFMVGASILSKILTYSGIGTLFGLALNCIINYFYTWRLGNAFDELFRYRGVDQVLSSLAELAVKKLMPVPTKSEVLDLLNFFRKKFE